MAKEKNYISSYTPQILANSPAYAKLFDANMKLTEKQAEKADALQLAYERETARIEQLTEEAAQKREEEGWWKMLLGAGVAVVGVIAIVGTAGMATPVVVTAYVAGGSAIAYGASNMVEAGQDIVYGAMGDPYTVAWNPIRDTIFCGNQTAYDIWGGISTTVAGLVVPIGQSYTFARTAGQSGKVLVQTVGKTVAKEFAEDFVIDKVSMGTGSLVQDFTGNANWGKLAGLTAGMATGTQSGKAFKSIDHAATGVKSLNHIDDVADVAKKVDSVTQPGVSGAKKIIRKDGTIEIIGTGDITEVIDNRPYLDPKNRPSFRKGIPEKVFETARKNSPDGKVRDPYRTDKIIEWEPGQPRKGVWDMGHLPEHKYSEMHKRYLNGELTPKEFRDWYNNPNNYRPELPNTNRGHKIE